MRYLSLLLVLGVTVAEAAEPQVKDIYGSIMTGCTVAADIDEGEADRIGPLTRDKLYSVFCYDSSDFSGVACRVKQGGSAVDASSGEGSNGEGELLFANEKTMVFVTGASNQYISFEPVADGTTQIGVACPRN